MARKLIVEIFASTAQYTKGLTKAGEQTRLFARTVDESSKHIGRSLAFATGGFAAFTGVTEFLRDSVDRAREAGVAQRSLAAQMKAGGESFQKSRDQIEKASLAVENFGFTSWDSAHALTVLDRGTGSVTRAIQLQGVAANLARAKNLDLGDAANILAKVFGHQETALRRAVPGLDKHRHGLELIYQAEQKLAGQAAAATTPAERFAAILHNTEVIVGTALLPTINKYLGSLGEWLDKMNRSGQLQKDVNGAVQTATGLFNDLKAIIDPLVGSFKALSAAVGSTKKAIELLVGAFAAWKVAGWITSLGRLGGSVGGIGTRAKVSAGEVSGLRGMLTRLGTMGAIGVTIAVSYVVSKEGQRFANWLGTQGIPGVGNQNFAPGSLPAIAQTAVAQGWSKSKFLEAAGIGGFSKAAAGAAYAKAVQAATYTVAIPKGFRPGAGAAPGTITGLPGTVSGRTVGTLTPEQTLQIGLARDPNNVSLLRQQAAYDQKQIDFLHRLHAAGKGPGAAKYAQELQGFYSDMTSQLSTIQSIQDAAAQKVTDARNKAAEARKRAAAKAAAAAKKAAAELAKQQKIAGEIGQVYLRTLPKGFLGVDYTIRRAALMQAHAFLEGVDQSKIGIRSFDAYKRQSYNEPIALQIALAQAQATGDTKGFVSALKAAKKAALRALHSGMLAGKAQVEAWNELASVNDQIKNAAKAGKDGYRQQRARAVALAHAQGSDYQFAFARGGPVVHIEHFHSSASNPAALENELVKRTNARAHVRRGAR